VQYIHFFNLEYFILLVYGVFTGATGNIDISRVPTQTIELMSRLAWIGTILTVLFLIGVVYCYRRLVEVEHAGWHARQQVEDIVAEEHIVAVAKNPQWTHIMSLANSASENDWRRAIMEADIMLSGVLQTQGYRGTTIGDMLKGANPIQFTTLDLAWAAHKTRNRIAHGGDFILTEREARATIDQYRRVFEEFNFI
jgi:hypothetical protein